MRNQYGNTSRNSLVGNSSSKQLLSHTKSNRSDIFSGSGSQQLQTSQSVCNINNLKRNDERQTPFEIYNHSQNIYLKEGPCQNQLKSLNRPNLSQSNFIQNNSLNNLSNQDIRIAFSHDKNPMQKSQFVRSHTPNNLSTKKSRQSGFFVHGLNKQTEVDGQQKSLFNQNNSCFEIKLIQNDNGFCNYNGSNLNNTQEIPEEVRNRRSISRSRRLMNMNEDDRKAFLRECVSVQDLVRASVQNLNKIITEAQDNQSSFNQTSSSAFQINLNKIKKTQSSPLKKSMTSVEIQNAICAQKLVKIQRWYIKVKLRQNTNKILKRLKNFRSKLNAIILGYLIRKKIKSNIKVKLVISNIRNLRNQLNDINSQKNKFSLQKLKQLKEKIKAETIKLINLLQFKDQKQDQAASQTNQNRRERNSRIFHSKRASSKSQISKIGRKSEVAKYPQHLNIEEQPQSLHKDVQSIQTQQKFLNTQNQIQFSKEFSEPILSNKSQVVQQQDDFPYEKFLKKVSAISSPKLEQKVNNDDDDINDGMNVSISSKRSSVKMDSPKLIIKEASLKSNEENKKQKDIKKQQTDKSKSFNSKTPTNQYRKSLLVPKTQQNDQFPKLKPQQRRSLSRESRSKTAQKERIAEINRQISAKRHSQSYIESGGHTIQNFGIDTVNISKLNCIKKPSNNFDDNLDRVDSLDFYDFNNITQIHVEQQQFQNTSINRMNKENNSRYLKSSDQVSAKSLRMKTQVISKSNMDDQIIQTQKRQSQIQDQKDINEQQELEDKNKLQNLRQYNDILKKFEQLVDENQSKNLSKEQQIENFESLMSQLKDSYLHIMKFK